MFEDTFGARSSHVPALDMIAGNLADWIVDSAAAIGAAREKIKRVRKSVLVTPLPL